MQGGHESDEGHWAGDGQGVGGYAFRGRGGG